MNVRDSNIEEIITYAHENRKKIVWLVRKMDDMALPLSEITEYFKLLRDDWISPANLLGGG